MKLPKFNGTIALKPPRKRGSKVTGIKQKKKI